MEYADIVNDNRALIDLIVRNVRAKRKIGVKFLVSKRGPGPLKGTCEDH
jgi:hypothetical protein